MKMLEETSVLILDDEKDFTEILELEISSTVKKTYTAYSVKEAYKIIETNQIDVVISDIKLRDGSGTELLQSCRKNITDPPSFIFMTAYSEFSENDLFKKGAIGVFFKPFNPKVLLSTIQGIHGKILVVDDNNLNRDLVRRRLERKGYVIVEASGGVEAIDKINSEYFDLVILDVMMPGMSGYDVLKIIRKKYSNINLPVIMATAKSERNDIVEALSKGANDYIIKPFDFMTVIARIKTQLSLKYAELELTEANKKALASVEAKSQFLANMSHEIRTPLNGIIGMTSLLSTTELTVDQNQFVEVIKSSGEALLTIVNDILDFSKIEAGKMETEEVQLSLQALIDESIEIFSDKAVNKNIEIVSYLDIKVPNIIKGDPSRLRQILGNFISNAIKFTSKGHIYVSVTLIEKHFGKKFVHFSVKDSGCGIKKGNTNKLFDPFIQEDRTTTRKFGGTGLGLAISKKLVELMHGEIGLESEHGKGSTFWIDIPLNMSNETKEEKENKLIGKKSILITDSKALLDSLGKSIEDRQITNHIFKSNEISNERIKEIRPDFVIIDQEINEKCPNEIVKTLSSLLPTSETRYILLCPLKKQASCSEKAKLAGFNEVIKKPIKVKNFFEQLSNSFIIKEVSESDRDKPDATQLDVEKIAPESLLPILLVEDNMTNQLVATKMIKKLGFKVEVAENGIEAVEKIKNGGQSYQVIFMDCQMPEMDGYQATQNIRIIELEKQMDRKNIIIAMTANAMKGDREKCIKAGMDDYISKPVKLEIIAEKINEWKVKTASMQKAS